MELGSAFFRISQRGALSMVASKLKPVPGTGFSQAWQCVFPHQQSFASTFFLINSHGVNYNGSERARPPLPPPVGGTAGGISNERVEIFVPFLIVISLM